MLGVMYLGVCASVYVMTIEIMATILSVCGITIILTAASLPCARRERSRTLYHHRNRCTHTGKDVTVNLGVGSMVCDMPVILIVSLDAF